MIKDYGASKFSASVGGATFPIVLPSILSVTA